MNKSIPIIILFILSFSFVSAIGQDFNLPLSWILTKTGTSVDTNDNGIIDTSENALKLNGQSSNYYLNVNDNVSIWNGINSRLLMSDQRYNDTLLILTVNNTLASQITVLNGSLQTEISNRISADSGLLNLINAVNQTASAATNYSQYTNISNLQSLNDTLAINSLNNSKYDKTGGTINGNVMIIGNLDVIGAYVNLTVTNSRLNGSFTPSQNNTFNIGASNNVWATGYFDTIQGKLDATYIQNAPWLVATDQRYNDTGAINAVNGRVDSLNSTKLNINDQRFNETSLITTETNNRISNDSYLQSQINAIDPSNVYNKTTMDSLLNNKLNVTDQRYNDTLSITNVNNSLNTETSNRVNNDSYLQSQINAVNSSASAASNYSQYTNISNLNINTTTLSKNNGMLDIVVSFFTNLFYKKSEVYNKTEIDSQVLGINSSINTKLNISDQRYNDTSAITSVNTSLNTEITTRQNADTSLNNTINALVSSNTTTNGRIDSLNSTKLNTNDQRYNETALITTEHNRIDALNTTAGIQALGFNTTVQLNGLYYSTANPAGYYNSSTIPAFVLYSDLVNSIGNWSADKVNYNNITQDYLNDSLSWLALTDQRYNESARVDAVNTTANTALSLATTANTTATNAMPKIGGTFSGNVNVTTNFTVDGGTLFVDATNDRIGINTLTPDNTSAVDIHGNLTVNGGIQFNSTIKYCFNNPKPCYTWYVDTTLWDCRNSTYNGTVQKRNASSSTVCA